ncbi:transcription antitermination factor NusB [Dolosigranulum savutiense]|uniref:Transcription antitermination protein NusB n=1 Tax=Dolosigranulum savutiense TaxID=3110288 RepID=A0AB74U7N2_9LACT
MTTARRITRERAFQALYMMDVLPALTEEQALMQVLNVQNNDVNIEETNLVALYKQLLPEELRTTQIAVDSLDYVQTLIRGVKEHQDTLDDQINQHLSKRTLSRVELANVIILRLATYELIYEDELAPSIVMDEAIELAKLFNDESSSKFINGILQSILDENSGA